MSTPDHIRIRKATHMADYVIRLEFTDGRVIDMDFHPVLSDPTENPMVREFLDITRFKKFRIADKQDLVWGDHEMGFPFETLYAGDFRVHWDGKKYPGPAKLKTGRSVVRRVAASRRAGAQRTRKA
ncbi:MAG: DUF2442 domain-containing protein [Flavobacteriales bacterium]